MTKQLWNGTVNVANSMFELSDRETVEPSPISDGRSLVVEVDGRAVVNTGVWGGPVNISVWLTDAQQEITPGGDSVTFALDLPSGILLVRRIDDLEEHEIEVGKPGRYSAFLEADGRDVARDLVVDQPTETYRLALRRSFT